MTADDQPAPLSQGRLAEIRAREQAATPGPWDGLVRRALVAAPEWVATVHVRYGQRGDLNSEDLAVAGAQARRNSEFITHARTDIPALLAEVDRLRAALERCNALAMGAVSISPPPIMEISMVARGALETADAALRGERGES